MRGSSLLLILVQAAAFWPVWPWFAVRMTDTSEAAATLVPLLSALFLGRTRPSSLAPVLPDPAGGNVRRVSLGLPLLLTAAYAVSVPTSPGLVQALLALAGLGATWACLFANGGGVARLGLFLLAVPVLPSLQFFLGYPMRRVVATAAAASLHLTGLDVRAEGVGLRWGSSVVLVDAPCSGVHLLWGSLYLALSVALLHRLRPAPTLRLALLAGVGAVFANALRLAALFYPESGLVRLPGWAHDTVGLVVFLGLGVGVVTAARAMAAGP